MENKLDGLSVVIPVYKENHEVVTNLYDSLVQLGASVTVVDDGDTVNLDEHVNEISYTPNHGYGYALKQGIRYSLHDTVMTIDGDGQHSVEDVVKLYTAYKLVPDCDMMIGCRHHLKESFLRMAGRKTLNFIGTLVSNHYLIDLNSGMRIFNRNIAMGYEPILCDTFSFTTSLTISMITDNHHVFWFPIDVKKRVHGSSHVRIVKDGLITLFYILWIGLALRTRNLRKWIRTRLFAKSQ